MNEPSIPDNGVSGKLKAVVYILTASPFLLLLHSCKIVLNILHQKNRKKF
ncbi:MAG: hypothetical protein CM1200mP16_03320 [Nitrospina sp.]|nr:MAG: hypothetical protein CM1200mP16_03320 [Nitrospina sp.]